MTSQLATSTSPTTMNPRTHGGGSAKPGAFRAASPSTIIHHPLRWLSLVACLLFLPLFSTLACFRLFYLLTAFTPIQLASLPEVLIVVYGYLLLLTCIVAQSQYPILLRLHQVFHLPRHIRYRREHAANTSLRRVRQQLNSYTIFVGGDAGRGTLPLLVEANISGAQLKAMLSERLSIPASFWHQRTGVLVRRGSRTEVPDIGTLDELGIGPMAHVDLRLLLRGGASQDGPDCIEGTDGRGRRERRTSKLDASLAAEKEHLGDDEPKRRKRRRKAKKGGNMAGMAVNSDGEDATYTSDGFDTESDASADSDVEILGEELAGVLPSRAVPLQPRKLKDKGKQPANPKVPREDKDMGTKSGATSSRTTVRGAEVPKGQRSKQARSPIYHFYERVDHNAAGETGKPGDRHYRSWHGARRVFTITKAMRCCTNSLVAHLKSFPGMFALYEAMRMVSGGDITQDEIDLATGKVEMTSALAARYERKLDARTESIKQAFQRQIDAQQEPWDDNAWERLVAEWMVETDQPFDEVEKPSFLAMIKYAQNHRAPLDYDMPGRKAFRRRIMQMGDETVDELKSMFAELEGKVTISIDAWTSSNQHAFLAIVAHYVTNEGQLEELLIDFQELVGAHTGENMADVVWKTLKTYGLERKVIAFMMDNATNNDTMVAEIARRCIADGIYFDAQQARLRCMPHTIHLAALKLMEAVGVWPKDNKKTKKAATTNYQDSVTIPVERDFDVDYTEADSEDADESGAPTASPGSPWMSAGIRTAIIRLRAIIKGVRVSPQRRQRWIDLIKRKRADEIVHNTEFLLMLILDVRTRWSSTHQMLRRALDYEEIIKDYVSLEKDLRQYELSDEDWQAIKLVTGWLKAFREATTDMSRTSRPMLSTVHSTFRELQQHLKTSLAELPAGTPSEIKEGLANAHHKLAEYYYKFDESHLYTWASLLDPRMSYEGLKDDYEDDDDLLDYLEDAKKALHEHFHDQYLASSRSYTQDPATALTSTSSASTSTSTSAATSANTSPSKLRLGARYKKRKLAVRDELEEYFTLPLEDFETCDPIEWWMGRKARFPNLYRLACDVLSIPGSAVAVERVFSGGRDTISLRRASLQPNTIRVLMMVKHRLRLARKRMEKADGVV